MPVFVREVNHAGSLNVCSCRTGQNRVPGEMERMVPKVSRSLLHDTLRQTYTRFCRRAAMGPLTVFLLKIKMGRRKWSGLIHGFHH